MASSALSAEVVADALADVHASGRTWVKARDLTDRLDGSPRAIGHGLRKLREQGRAEQWGAGSGTRGAASWRLIETVGDETDE